MNASLGYTTVATTRHAKTLLEVLPVFQKRTMLALNQNMTAMSMPIVFHTQINYQIIGANVTKDWSDGDRVDNVRHSLKLFPVRY